MFLNRKNISYLTVVFVFGAASTAWGAGNIREREVETTASSRAVQPPRSEGTVRMGVQSTPQLYGVPTYDAAFKWVLSQDNIRLSFLHAFASDVKIKSSRRLDDHMNPVEDLQLLRDFLHKKATADVVGSLSSSGAYVVKPSGEPGVEPVADDMATAFLNEMIGRFDEIRQSFPKSRYNGTMDFVCELDGGDYALVEMQVIPQDYWDRRALAYVAAFYGNQLSRGSHWESIKKVVGINILGGGKDSRPHWVDQPDHFVRHYKFEDQLNGKGRYIDGIEIIQYSIMHSPVKMDDNEQADWVTFLKNAHYMTEEDVKAKITTPAVLEAFERVRLGNLPQEVKEAYDIQQKEYDKYSQYTDHLVGKGKAEGKAEGKVEGLAEGELRAKQDVARACIVDGDSDAKISRITGLTVEQIQALRGIP